ncbi:hypothetical protein M426DRAFT_13264 [Hypoxylon sp. CI-4A]|nr:hypothetical protein M426DRAFT_13264 [Hypoxylon sp. CI-4A]
MSGLPTTQRPTAYHYPESHVPRNSNPFEAVYSGIFGDASKKWGPFSKIVGEARQKNTWNEWRVSDIADREPDDNQADPDTLEYQQAVSTRSKATKEIYHFTTETLKDVRPAHLDFIEILGGKTQHSGDYDDEFFRYHWKNLYRTIEQWASRWFDGNLNLDNINAPRGGGENQIWSVPLSPQFIEYARLVAHEDQGLGGWPVFLNDHLHRKWLMVGILSQIMEKKIFNELLFGADDFFEEELSSQDIKWLQREGFGRKASRAITAQYAVQDRLVPQEFYPLVDDLAAKTMKIYLPILNVFKVMRTESWYKPEVFLGEVHTILQYAGFIQVCQAISPSIFHVLSATPGSRMDYEIEAQSDVRIYRESKDFWSTEDKKWHQLIESGRSGHGGYYSPDLPRDDNEKRLLEYHRIRGAKVKVAVFPRITRYTAYNKGKGANDGDEAVHYDSGRPYNKNSDGTTEGMGISNIVDCMVVYYQGLIYPPDDIIESTPLLDYLKELPQHHGGLVGVLATTIVALFSISRHAFWHSLVLGGFLTLLGSLYTGREFVSHALGEHILGIMVGVFFFFVMSRAQFEQNNRELGYLIAVTPIILAYIAGAFYYVNKPDESSYGFIGSVKYLFAYTRYLVAYFFNLVTFFKAKKIAQES